MKGGEASTDNCPPCPVCQGKLNEQPTEKKVFFPICLHLETRLIVN